MGIEPTYLAWKARALPLSYTRKRSLYSKARVLFDNPSGFLAQVKFLKKDSIIWL